MPTITEVKKDRIFYKGFYSLIETLKSIAGSQFHIAEQRVKLFGEMTKALEDMVALLDVSSIQHPVADPKDAPPGVVVVTSDAGLMGGVNYKLMMKSMDFARANKGQLIVIGIQGKKFTLKSDLPVTYFPGVIDTECARQAAELTDYILKEVNAGRIGAVKVMFPYAASIGSQYTLEWDLLPCGLWPKARLPAGHGDHEHPAQPVVEAAGPLPGETIMESLPADIVDYAALLWIRQKLTEIFQFSRVAEYAARIIHLEESSQRVKEIENKLRLKYFRIHHEIIDQQMRELFTARSLYA